MEQGQQPLRQPLTFWQWITGQQGTLFVPPPPPIQLVNPARTALDAIETAIERIHLELNDIRNDEFADSNDAYHKLVDALNPLHLELTRRSQEETKNETIPARQS